MLALGLPKHFVCGFLSLYTRMTRFLSFKQWTRAQAISTPNGVVQGCSLSLLCINIHMAIWAWLVSCIHGVDFRAFIDDTYLWTRMPSIDSLVAAVRATELWDSLCGQFLNAGKCELFASHAPLRKALKQAFPQMRLVEVVNILGAFVQTTRKNVGCFPVVKLQAALRDCEAIRSLPCDGDKRAQILSTKVLPQIAFAPQLNFIPKRLLARLQSAIADAIWQDRPRWRSKHLLLCIAHKAHKLDPFLYRAVATIIESARFLRSSQFARQSWTMMFEQDQFTPQAWMTQFGQACQILDIEWSSPFGISVLGASEVHFLEFSAADLKCILKSLAAHKCYSVACLMPRKDIHKALGFLDLGLTLSARKKLAAIPNNKFSFLFHWESAITGCALTADRLAAAGLVDSSMCRFCHSSKESMHHFVEECQSLPADLKQPTSLFSLGPNFDLLGITELPLDIIRNKLQVSRPCDLQVAEWIQPLSPTLHVWTDGSVQLSKHPWITMASFAVVSADQQLLASGQVHHWRLSSYTAELWAVLTAFAMAEQPLVVHTDSLTVVDQYRELLRLDCVQVEWTHTSWWGFLHTLLHQRQGFCDTPLQVVWCPARLLEHIPADDLTDEPATAAGSNRQDIPPNRPADWHAKQQIDKHARRVHADIRLKEQDVFARQLWLANLNKACKKDTPLVPADPPPEREPCRRVSPREQCPRWAWDAKPDDFPWQVHNNVDMDFKNRPQLSSTNFRTFLQFANTLRWRVGEGRACSVFELAVFAFLQGWRYELPTGTICTVQAYAATTRAAISRCKSLGVVCAPLLLDKGNKCNGRTSPKGAFIGAEAFVDNATLEVLFRAFERGAKASPASWAIPFDLLL